MSEEKNNKLSVADKKEIEKSDGEHTKTGVQYSPAVDIYETENSITLLADLPGVKKENLDINVEDKQLTITGLVETGLIGNEIEKEYGIGGFTRSFKLGDSIDLSKISASLEDGVLTLLLPKAEKLKARKIEVRAS
ncbi:MAG: Hsp20/alpha crystallin family protein [Deltaproteobacteria bacterium]|nr:Hsp20/alpha crystallin family protein [Deltaproteobacteria bacterium]